MTHHHIKMLQLEAEVFSLGLISQSLSQNNFMCCF